ncbi:MAG: tetratricopeptide repeat protein [Planctomycetota bacterium]
MENRIYLEKFISDFLFRYKHFLRTYLAIDNLPFFYLTLWLTGMARIINKMEFKQKYPSDNWIIVWLVIMLGGIVAGFLYYWVTGTVYHWFARLSGGARNYRLSRYILLYSFLPYHLIIIFSIIINMIIYGNKYFAGNTNTILNYVEFGITLIVLVYSLILSFIGIRVLQQTKLIRSVIFFIILPIILLIAAIGFVTFFESLAPNYNDQAIEQMDKGNFESAEQLFKKALIFADDLETKITVLNNLIYLYEDNGKTPQAIESYQKVLTYYKPNTLEYFLTIGSLNLLKGNIKQAIANFEKVLAINPDEVKVHNELGLIFLGNKDKSFTDYERALVYNEKCYALDKTSQVYLYNLAYNYFALERYTNALPLLESLEKTSLNNAKVKYFIGLSLYYQGDLIKAKKFLKEAIVLDESLDTELAQEIIQEED